MNVLKEIVQIVGKDKCARSWMTSELGASSMLTEFFEMILADRFQNDEEAAEHFYPSSDSTSSYRKLKARLKSQLKDIVLLIDTNQSQYSDREKAYYQSHKDWAAANVLLGKNARQAGISITHDVLRYAEKYEFSNLALEASRVLRLHYGAREGNAKKYAEYREKCARYNEICQVENMAEELYTDLVIEYVNNRTIKEDVSVRALDAYRKLEQRIRGYESYRANLYASLIRLMIYSSVNDYKNILRVCDESIRFYEEKPYFAKVPLQIYYFQKLICHAQLRDYELGMETAEKCRGYLDEGTFNWFKFKELAFILSMHTQKYAQAARIFLETTEHKRFEFLPSVVKEVWKIYEAYLHYLVELDKLNPDKEKISLDKFRLGKFLNETIIFSKDKSGMNIPILVAQVLFLILHRKYNEAIERIDAIEKYRARHLSRKDNKRSFIFIKMLLQIPLGMFHQAGVMRKAKRYVKQFKEIPVEIANQASTLEVIPYDDLWEMLIGSLENQFYRGGKSTNVKNQKAAK